MVTICNAAGEPIKEFSNVFDAVTWWRSEGIESDYIDELDVLVSEEAMRQEGMI